MFILGNAPVVQCFVLQLPRAWVQALTGELRSLKLHGQEVSKMMSILFFWLCHVACGILFQIREESVPPSVESQSPNHWTAKGIPSILVIKQISNIYFHNFKKSPQ